MLIQNYQNHWPRAFDAIAAVLRAAAGDHLAAIEHVGSTAVPGLAAKAIIDIDLVYPTDGDFAAVKATLVTCGYYHKGDQGISGREAFRRNPDAGGHPILDLIDHHLYVCRADNEELRRHLAFRNYLRAHPEAREEYARLKREIARLVGQERGAYAALKEVRAREFVEGVLIKSHKL